MKTGKAIILSITVCFLFSLIYLPIQNESDERESVILTRVIDGDTVELEDGRRIRLLNINTPESGETGSELAKNFLKNFEGQIIELDNAGTEKYGRTLGRLYFEDAYLNLEIVRLGYAHYFLVDSSELKKFKETQKRAYEEGIGIWEHSRYFGCAKVEIDKKKELVTIDKICNVSWLGWTIKDETTRRFVFKQNFNQRFILYSGKGNNKGNLGYWNRGNVWNDDKDSVFIRDNKGLLVYYDSYGY